LYLPGNWSSKFPDLSFRSEVFSFYDIPFVPSFVPSPSFSLSLSLSLSLPLSSSFTVLIGFQIARSVYALEKCRPLRNLCHVNNEPRSTGQVLLVRASLSLSLFPLIFFPSLFLSFFPELSSLLLLFVFVSSGPARTPSPLAPRPTPYPSSPPASFLLARKVRRRGLKNNRSVKITANRNSLVGDTESLQPFSRDRSLGIFRGIIDSGRPIDNPTPTCISITVGTRVFQLRG